MAAAAAAGEQADVANGRWLASLFCQPARLWCACRPLQAGQAGAAWCCCPAGAGGGACRCRQRRAPSCLPRVHPLSGLTAGFWRPSSIGSGCSRGVQRDSGRHGDMHKHACQHARVACSKHAPLHALRAPWPAGGASCPSWRHPFSSWLLLWPLSTGLYELRAQKKLFQAANPEAGHDAEWRRAASVGCGSWAAGAPPHQIMGC